MTHTPVVSETLGFDVKLSARMHEGEIVGIDPVEHGHVSFLHSFVPLVFDFENLFFNFSIRLVPDSSLRSSIPSQGNYQQRKQESLSHRCFAPFPSNLI
jgi:hypothetical protein